MIELGAVMRTVQPSCNMLEGKRKMKPQRVRRMEQFLEPQLQLEAARQLGWVGGFQEGEDAAGDVVAAGELLQLQDPLQML